jgi:hypothetical protein
MSLSTSPYLLATPYPFLSPINQEKGAIFFLMFQGKHISNNTYLTMFVSSTNKKEEE